jgi:hypothetical protein
MRRAPLAALLSAMIAGCAWLLPAAPVESGSAEIGTEYRYTLYDHFTLSMAWYEYLVSLGYNFSRTSTEA